MSNWKPMLAAEAVLGEVKYPIVGLPKLNGVRGINQGGWMLARSLKQIPNAFIRSLYEGAMLDGFDGELVVGDFAHEEVFPISTSGVMSRDGTPDVHWWVFDKFHDTLPYLLRLERLRNALEESKKPRITQVDYKILKSDDDLVEYSEWALSVGYEGLVLRDPTAKYKQGRSTAREGGFMRYCPWKTSEALILSVHEGKVNTNESVINELGFKKKPSHKAGKVGSGRAGAVTVRDLITGVEFNIPVPGESLQAEVFANPDKFVGIILKYKFKPSVKVGGPPRFAQWIGPRHPFDLSR